MIAPSTSSGEEQLALTGDRIECLKEMSVSLTATNGVSISDNFFVVTSLHSSLNGGCRLVGLTSVVHVEHDAGFSTCTSL